MKKIVNFKFPISVQQQSLETIVNQTITSNADVTGKANIDSPTFTGEVTAPTMTVTTTLNIPGGKIWID